MSKQKNEMCSSRSLESKLMGRIPAAVVSGNPREARSVEISPSSPLSGIGDTLRDISVQKGHQMVSKREKKFVPSVFYTEPFYPHSPSRWKVPKDHFVHSEICASWENKLHLKS